MPPSTGRGWGWDLVFSAKIKTNVEHRTSNEIIHVGEGFIPSPSSGSSRRIKFPGTVGARLEHWVRMAHQENVTVIVKAMLEQPKKEEKMDQWKRRMAAVWFGLGVLAWCALVPSEASAQNPAVDPAAVQVLKRMTDFMDGLQKFSVKTQNTIEDEYGSGHRVDRELAASVTVKRPNKLLAMRAGEVMNQRFFYDGKTLTLYNPSVKVYGSQPAPATIEKMIDFARETVGILLPAADLLYRNAFPLLMQDVNLAAVVGKAVVGGVRCDHLLFSRPGVDFQVWVAEGKRPFPHKYVVTETPSMLAITTVLSDWNLKPAADDARFNFVPPKGVQSISFMPIETTAGGSNR